MKKIDIVVTGDCNLDLIFNDFERVPQMGEEIIANQFELTLGSSAGIVAAHLSALGANVAYVGAVGKDNFGHQFKALIESYGVCTDYMVEKPNFKTGCTVVMAQNENRANLTHTGAMAQLCPDDLPWQLINETAYFHLSNPYVLPHFRNILPELYKKVKSHNTITSLDPQWDVEEKWDTDLKTLLPYLDFFLPNEQELRLLLNANKLTSQELKSISTSEIIKTCGYNGIERLLANDSELHKGYPNNNPVDCVGAGDAFTAGFLSAHIKNKPFNEAIDLGCKTGALSTTIEGGTVPYKTMKEFNGRFTKLL